jgi:hypothetical protein
MVEGSTVGPSILPTYLKGHATYLGRFKYSRTSCRRYSSKREKASKRGKAYKREKACEQEKAYSGRKFISVRSCASDLFHMQNVQRLAGLFCERELYALFLPLPLIEARL